jgi:glycosyltransferase involved in cell wall biosynthesis
MRLVMLSWRYLGHPQAGGAEIVTHEVLRRCVDAGWDVTCFTAEHDGAPREERVGGVRVIRDGAQWSVHARAWRWLRGRLGSYDRVVEQINTLPFLTPLYVPRAKRRLLIHQLAREYWWRETRGLFRAGAPLGYLLEPWQMRLYRSTPTITISDSSRSELEALGIPVVKILPMAVYVEPVAALAPRTGPLRIASVGRVTPAKFVEEAIEAFAIVQARVPEAQMDVMGSGDERYRQRLEQLSARLGLQNVVFHGRVDEDRKRELLEAAHVHVFTSHREGWGLTVTEAACVGTPSVGYDVPGVRDSIADPRLLAAERTPARLAERILSLNDDPALYDEVRTTAWERARELHWDRTAQAFMEAVR